MTQHFGLTDSLTTMTPTVRNFRDGVLLPQLARYRELIGELVYLTIVGPDVAHVVHILTVNLLLASLLFTVQLFYDFFVLHGIMIWSLLSLELLSYFDTGWVDDPNTHRSNTGFCIFLRFTLISWCSKIQESVSHSAIKAEY